MRICKERQSDIDEALVPFDIRVQLVLLVLRAIVAVREARATEEVEIGHIVRLGPFDLGIDVVTQADAVGIERIVARSPFVEDRQRGEQKDLGVGVLLFQFLIAVVHAAQHGRELRGVEAVGLGVVAERADGGATLREVVAGRPEQVDVVRLIASAAAIHGILHASLMRRHAVTSPIDAVAE